MVRNALGERAPARACRFDSCPLRHPSLKLRNGRPMYYTYILLSSKSHIFYFGSTNNLKERLRLHNAGMVLSTKLRLPWAIVWYCAFETEKQARDFELYLKSGSGKSFAYKHLVSVALAEDFARGRKGSPKRKA